MQEECKNEKRGKEEEETTEKQHRQQELHQHQQWDMLTRPCAYASSGS